MDESAESLRIYPCPLPDCRWMIASEPPGPMENDGALADVFGWGIFSARLRRSEEQIADHLQEHSPQEFAIALALANKRIEELERQLAEVTA